MKQQRSCNELGLCQHRNPACSGCTWRTDAKIFAPGAIEGPFNRSHHRLAFSRASRFGKMLLLVAFLAIAFASVSLVMGFALGYINHVRWLP
jgi:hypothetical protein